MADETPVHMPVDPNEAENENNDPLSDILGQDDIDSLLQQVSQDEPPAAQEQPGGERCETPLLFSDGRRLGENETVRIEPYDFRNPAFLGETEMRRLRLMHEDFIRFLEARIALFLRMDFALSMTKLTTVSYEQAVEEVESPSHLVLFRANPMPGMGFLEMSPRLALTIASSILGGKGQAPRLERYLTKIEIDLIEEFLNLLLQEWCSQWATDQNLEPVIAGHEVVANVLQICEHDTVMLALEMEAHLRGCVGKLCIYVPLYMIEDSVRRMQEQRKQDNQPASSKAGPAWRKGFERIPVDGSGVIPVGETTVREVMNKWKPGTIIQLPEEALQSVVLSLAGIQLFKCEVGAEGEQIALNILEKQNKREPLWNTKK
ncbi:MAG: flagellar motor switch protein FliM [Puniceicoccaceae bacterium]